MITNISARNKDGMLMTLAEYDTDKRKIRLYWSKAKVDARASALLSEAKRSDPKAELSDMPFELQYPLFHYPEDAISIEFIDKDFDNRYQCSIEDFAKRKLPDDKGYFINLKDFKKTR